MYKRYSAIIFYAFLICISSSAIALKQEYSLDEELMYRINFGSANDVRILLDKGANPNAIGKTGEYALSVAIGRDDSEAGEIVKVLLDHGAKPNVLDKSNSYPIINAAVNNKNDIVGLLLAKGADFHAKSVNGKSLLDIAKANNNAEMVKMFQKMFDDEAAFIASLHTPERFAAFINTYIYNSCQYQYWSFVKGSLQMPNKEVDLEERIKRITSDLSSTIEQIQKYYPTTPTADLQRIANGASQKVFDQLDAMISNENRSRQSVGTATDADKRCAKISGDVKIEFPPSVYQ